MAKHYRHLAVRERERLAKLYHEGHTLAEIAEAGTRVAEVCRKMGICEQTYFR